MNKVNKVKKICVLLEKIMHDKLMSLTNIPTTERAVGLMHDREDWFKGQFRDKLLESTLSKMEQDGNGVIYWIFK